MLNNKLYSCLIPTPLGDMLAIASLTHLYMLRFTDCITIPQELTHLEKTTSFSIITGTSAPLISITKELTNYFAGSLITFQTPIKIIGTTFQEKTWKALQGIAYNSTQSYTHLAALVNQPSAFRAVANANSANKLAIIIPCHRIIGKNGTLHGYNGGVERKAWLIQHEKNYCNDSRSKN